MVLKGKLLIFTIIISFSLGFSINALADLAGGKWSKSTVYFGVNGETDNYISSIKNGFTSWNGSNSNISYKYFEDVSLSQPVDVWTRWYTDQLGFPEQQVIAEGYYGFGVPYPIGSSTHEYGYMYLVDDNFIPLSYFDKRFVVMHEAGHLLGLDHTTNFLRDSVMDEWDQFKFDYPQSYDKTELGKIY